MWTRFMDMHFGGRQKEKWHYIYIEAPQEEAELIFYNRFGHNPNKVTCPCCGEDYSISEEEELTQITAYDRGCSFVKDKYIEELRTVSWAQKYQTLEQYITSLDVLIIYASDIKPEEKVGELPQQGYVWVD